MSNDHYRKVRYAFRFLNVPLHLAEELRALKPGLELKTAKYKDTENLVVSLELTDGCNYDWLPGLIARHSLSPMVYGVWVSLVTESVSDGVRVPEFLIDILKKVGGQFDFSFTCV